MATTKKNVPVEETTIEKALEATVEAPVENKASVKRATKKAAVKEEGNEGAKDPAKKTAAKKTTAKKAAKEVQCEIAVQFAGKSYTQEDLVKIAKDVWVYDLNRKAEELVSVALYVKPEECSAYYVFNDTETGSFLI